MMLWFLISEGAREGLIELQGRLYPYISLQLPTWAENLAVMKARTGGYCGHWERLEEIDQIMRQAPVWSGADD